MRISQVIKELQQKQEELGDVYLQVCNEAGDWGDAYSVEMVNVGTEAKPEFKVYIEG